MLGRSSVPVNTFYFLSPLKFEKGRTTNTYNTYSYISETPYYIVAFCKRIKRMLKVSCTVFVRMFSFLS